MRKIGLFTILTIQFVFAGEALLTIDNFTENGDETVTFDIMILNDVDVQATQFTILSGNGEYGDSDACQCSFECNGDVCEGIIPDGCTECYYDNGLDFVANAYEEGYYNSGDNDSGYNGCSLDGACADDTPYCDPDDGICSDESYTDREECLEAGICSNFSDIYECNCVQSGATWTSYENIWYPDNLWTSYSLPGICEEQSCDISDDPEEDCGEDGNLVWNYANQDASGDDYRVLIEPSDCTEDVDCANPANSNHACCTTNFQFCRMPGINSPDPSSGQIYQHYFHIESYDCSGHCSQVDSYCRDLDQCFDLDEGLACDNGFSSGCCNNSINADWAWQSPYREYPSCIENGFTWTAYDTQAVCETYGGIWVGSESGTQGNDMYDLGENFIDTDRSLDITSVSNLPGGFYASEANDEMLIFSFSGEVIPSVDSHQRLATITADITGDIGDFITLGARNICKDDYQLHCVLEMIISDVNAERLDASFTPSIWIIGSGTNPVGSEETSSDAVCSWYAGETIEIDDYCDSICGDYYCDNAGGEDYVTCKMDCPETVDGDGYCNLYDGENFQNSSDCIEFGCGDYACSNSETIESCPIDCLSYCGDWYCDAAGGENENNCNQDCFGDCSATIPGDVNSDEVLDILDILQIVNFSMSFIIPTPYEECVADINQDDFINILDILILVNIILN